jgi:hypothetical protein
VVSSQLDSGIGSGRWLHERFASTAGNRTVFNQRYNRQRLYQFNTRLAPLRPRNHLKQCPGLVAPYTSSLLRMTSLLGLCIDILPRGGKRRRQRHILNWECMTALASCSFPIRAIDLCILIPCLASALKPKAVAECGNSARTELRRGGR